MFFQLLYIHLFRPFLKYTQATSPLPSHVSPRKLCTQAAGMISKLMRLYKRSHGLRQIVNFAIYVVHSACTIHLLNLPDKIARRDIIHGVKHLEEMAEGWLVARRTLVVMSTQARKWRIDLPEEAAAVLARTDAKFGLSPSPFASPSPKLTFQSTESSLSSRTSVVPPQISQQPQMPINWQRTAQTSTNSVDMLEMNETNSADALQAMANSFSASASLSHQFTPQSHTPQFTTPQYALSPVSQDFSPRTNRPENIKTTSIDYSTKQQQSLRGARQIPLYPQQQRRQQQHDLQIVDSPAHQQSTQQQARTIAQPSRRKPSITATTLQQQQAALRGNKVASIATSDMFGGVEALLREGQEWWMKDQSHDLASGFENWSGSGSVSSRGWMSQQQRQGEQEQSQFQAQAQAQAQAQQQQHQARQQQQQAIARSIPSPQQHFQQQQQQQFYELQKSNSIPEERYVTSTAMCGVVDNSIATLPHQSNGDLSVHTVQGNPGEVSARAAMYNFGNLEYNEDEWYQ